jgi:hypothetical protein
LDYQLTDERLAWLAVRDDLSRLARRGSLIHRVRDALGARQTLVRRDGTVLDTGSSSRRHTSAKMSAYAVAVDEMTQELTADDRRVLRTTGALPEWFLPKVKARYAQIRDEYA